MPYKQSYMLSIFPAIYVGFQLLKAGATLKIYDPMVKKNKIIEDLQNLIFKETDLKLKSSELINRVNIYLDVNTVINGTDAISVITEWDKFRLINWKKIRKSGIPVF